MNPNYSNEGRPPYGRPSYGGYGRPPQYGQYYQQPPRPPIQEDTLKEGEIQAERKFILFSLKENPRGRFLRITEEGHGRRNCIIVPATGLLELKKLVDEMVKASDEIPAAKKSAPEHPEEPGDSVGNH